MILATGKEQITLEYGWSDFNGGYNHKGIDLVKEPYSLDAIVAIEDGTVTLTRSNVTGFIYNSYGNYVEIKHANGYSSFYAHLKEVYVTVRTKSNKRTKDWIYGSNWNGIWSTCAF